MSKMMILENLHSETTSHDVRALCTQFGTVLSVDLKTDAVTGLSRGVAIVEMTDGVDAALEILHQHCFQGNVLRVKETRLTEPRKAPGRFKPGH